MLIRKVQDLRSKLSTGSAARRIARLEGGLDRLRRAVGRIEIQQKLAKENGPLSFYEAQVYSQNGEDGIIQRLLQLVPVPSRTFVEFGVEDYREANTRFLLVNDNWSGMVIDGSERNVCRIREEALYWKHELHAVCSFIDRDNINDLLGRAGFVGDLGLLSIDIDGNDYWVWESIRCVRPSIVIVEYNALFGPRATVSVPYEPTFMRSRAHYSNLFYGASLAALEALGRRKGYRLVGSNSAGNNAFFVRDDLVCESLPSLTSEEAFVQSRFRESRGPSGELTFLGLQEQRRLVGHLQVVNTETGGLQKVEDL